jgi:hypothetical protein
MVRRVKIKVTPFTRWLGIAGMMGEVVSMPKMTSIGLERWYGVRVFNQRYPLEEHEFETKVLTLSDLENQI